MLKLPAEGVDARDDVAKLRKELDEARAQGEAYARELAAAWTAGGEPSGQSSYPPPSMPAAERHAAVARLAGGIASTLRAIISPVDRELAELAARSQRKSAPELEAAARAEVDPRFESMRRKLSVVGDFVAELGAVGEVDPQEPQREVDLVELVRAEAKVLAGRATRAGVGIVVRMGPEEGDPAPRAFARVAAGAAAIVARELMAHAVSASPRDSEVAVTVMARAGGLGSRIVIDDCGTALPVAACRALLALEVEPGTFGRPSSVSLFLANEIAVAQGALLELSDAPVTEGTGGGLRVTVTFPR